jgi:hypothetical protein
MAELTAQDIASVSAGYWANFYRIKLQTGEFSFYPHHPYQKEPMESKSRRKCFIKATGGGFSEMEILTDLHGMKYKKYPLGVLYMLPTNDDVIEFSKSRFNPLLLANRQEIGRFIQKTDTASLKKIGSAFLYIRGARLTQKVGMDSESEESAKLRSIQVDKGVFDEYDLMDEEVPAKVRGRMGHSLVKEEVYISNPTQTDFGIDRMFQQSDQRHWFRKCTSCGEWTCAELSFPNCVKTKSNGKGYIACDKCGKELLIWSGIGTGEWVAKFPANSDYMAGYRWSQLTSVFNDPAEILNEFINPPEGNLGDVYRLRLGLAYSSKEEKLRKEDVLACCGRDIMPLNHTGPCAMGVDVGKIKHIVIGIRTGHDRYEILYVARYENFNDIHDLARRFNVKSAIIDLRPYEDEARQFQKQERFKIFLAEYFDAQMQEVVWNEGTGTVKIHKTSIFDTSHRLISSGHIRLPRQCPEIEQFTVQCCNCAKFEEKNKRTKQVVFRYRPTGDLKIGDHYRSALNYFLLAAGSTKIAKADGYPEKLQKFAVHETTKL